MDLRRPHIDDPVIAAYARDVDLGLLRRNLARTPQERIDAMIDMLGLTEALRAAPRDRAR